jgi:hypothetical protein
MAEIKPIRTNKIIKPFEPRGVSPFLQISASNRGLSDLAQKVVTTVANLKNDIDQKEENERILNKNTTQAAKLEERLQQWMISKTDDPNYANLTPEEFDKAFVDLEKKEFNDLKFKVYGNDPRGWGRFESAYYTIFNNNRRKFRQERLLKQRMETQIRLTNNRNKRLEIAELQLYGPGAFTTFLPSIIKQLEQDNKSHEMLYGGKDKNVIAAEREEIELAVWTGQLNKDPRFFDKKTGTVDYNKVVEWLTNPAQWNQGLHNQDLRSDYRDILAAKYKKLAKTQNDNKTRNDNIANTELFETSFRRITNWESGNLENITIDDIKNTKDKRGNLLKSDQIKSLIGYFNKKIAGDPAISDNYGFNYAVRRAVMAGDKRFATLNTKYKLRVNEGGNLVSGDKFYIDGVVQKKPEETYTILTDPRLTQDTILFVTKELETRITNPNEAISKEEALTKFDGLAIGLRATVVGKIESNESKYRYQRFLYEKQKEFINKLTDPDNPKKVNELLDEFIDGKPNPDYIFNKSDLAAQGHIVGRTKQIKDVTADYAASTPRDFKMKDKGVSLGGSIGTTPDGKPVYKYINPDTNEEENVFEKSITFKLPSGQYVNVPTIHNGKIYTNIQIQDMYRDKKVTHTSIHDTQEEAIRAADERSKNTRVILNQKPYSYEKALEIGNNLPWDTLPDNEKQEYIKYFKQKYPGKDLPSSWDVRLPAGDIIKNVEQVASTEGGLFEKPEFVKLLEITPPGPNATEEEEAAYLVEIALNSVSAMGSISPKLGNLLSKIKNLKITKTNPGSEIPPDFISGRNIGSAKPGFKGDLSFSETDLAQKRKLDSLTSKQIDDLEQMSEYKFDDSTSGVLKEKKKLFKMNQISKEADASAITKKDAQSLANAYQVERKTLMNTGEEDYVETFMDDFSELVKNPNKIMTESELLSYFKYIDLEDRAVGNISEVIQLVDNKLGELVVKVKVPYNRGGNLKNRTITITKPTLQKLIDKELGLEFRDKGLVSKPQKNRKK